MPPQAQPPVSGIPASNGAPSAVVITLTWGMSLKAWEETGLLSREWGLFKALLDSGVASLVLLSYGTAGDREILARVAGEHASRVHLICNEHAQSNADFVQSLPARVAPLLAGVSSVVVKSNQLAGADVAVRLTHALREMIPTSTIACVARGGYLWSRFVAHEHGPDSEQAKQAEAREREACQQADIVVGTTSEMIRDLTWRYTLDPGRSMVIPNYVLSEPAPTGTPREPGLVLYAGQLTPRKRVDMLIRACALAAESSPELRLRVVGEGPQRDELVALAGELGVRAEFLPRMPHMELLREMDQCAIYAQASELEGHPKTVIEAMSRGTPVVVVDAPGLGEVVQHGVTGLRCPGTHEALGQAISGLLMDNDWAGVLGQSAQGCTLASLSLEAVLPRELAAYRAALLRASGHGRAAHASEPRARHAG